MRFAEFSNCKIPQVVGAIGSILPRPQCIWGRGCDGVQTKVIGSSNDSKVDYFNRKQHHSINTQATIGASLVFVDLTTDFLGSVHDSCVLRHSTLYRKAEKGQTLSMLTETAQDIAMRSILLGGDFGTI